MKDNTFAHVLVFIVTLLLLVFSGFAWVQLEKLEQGQFFQNYKNLERISWLDNALNTALLETHLNELQDFDTVAGLSREIQFLITQLSVSELANEDIIPLHLTGNFQHYLHLLQNKLQATERYKADQAIIRNSIRYLPLLQQSLLIKTSKTQAGRHPDKKITNTFIAIHHYLLFPDQSSHKLQKQLEQLTNLQKNVAPELAKKIAELLLHIRIILQYRDSTVEMLNSASSSSSYQAATDLLSTYSVWHTQQQQRRKYIPDLLFKTTLFLILLLFLSLLMSLVKKQRIINLLQSENQTKEAQYNLLTH